MIPRFSPLDTIFELGPFIKSPATCHFRDLYLFCHFGETLTLVVGRQLIRPPYDTTTHKSIEVKDPKRWTVEYDYMRCAFSFDRGLSHIEKLLRLFCEERVFRNLREMAVVALRVKTESDPIGIVTDSDFKRFFDEQALPYFMAHADDELRLMQARDR